MGRLTLIRVPLIIIFWKRNQTKKKSLGSPSLWKIARYSLKLVGPFNRLFNPALLGSRARDSPNTRKSVLFSGRVVVYAVN